VSAGRSWVPLTAPLWASGLPGYLWSTAVVALGVGLAERVLGTRKAAALALLVQLLGTALGLGFVAMVAIRGAPAWPRSSWWWTSSVTRCATRCA
jgi:hypothetical protein